MTNTEASKEWAEKEARVMADNLIARGYGCEAGTDEWVVEIEKALLAAYLKGKREMREEAANVSEKMSCSEGEAVAEAIRSMSVENQ